MNSVFLCALLLYFILVYWVCCVKHFTTQPNALKHDKQSNDKHNCKPICAFAPCQQSAVSANPSRLGERRRPLFARQRGRVPPSVHGVKRVGR